MTKKYLIHYNFITSQEVIAESEDEALSIANQENFYDDFEMTEKSVVCEEELSEDLSALITKAETIIKRWDEEGKDIVLHPWPKITSELWNGYKMELFRDVMSYVFWDYESDEIGFNTSNSAADFQLSEQPEIEQYNICQAIIQEGGVENA